MNGERIKILMIDSNHDFVYLINKTLAQTGGQRYEITHTDQLEKALGELSSQTFDAIVMDISLPKQQDWNTFSKVRLHAPETPIVVLTADDNLEVALQSMRRGAQDYLVKGKVTGQLLIRSLRYAIERQQMIVTLRRLAMIDELTHLYNRQGFLVLANQHLKLAHRQESPLALVLVDVTGMGKINEEFGHDAGDIALIHTAEVLRRTFRSTDILARLAGDEFVVLALDVSPQNADQVAIRVRQAFSWTNTRGELPYELTASIDVKTLELNEDLEIDSLLPEIGSPPAQEEKALKPKKTAKPRE